MSKVLSVIFFAFAIFAHGQSIQRNFFDKKGQKTDSAQSYYFSQPKMKIGKGKEEIDTLFCFYTMSGKMKDYQVWDEGFPNGPFVSYYESGTAKEKGIYVKGAKAGEFTTWYPGGQAQQIVTYAARTQTHWPVLISYSDSSGTELVTKGNGNCRCYSKDGDDVVLQVGKVVDGLQDAEWVGFVNGELTFKEKYSSGKLVNGIRISGTEEIPYKEIEVQPEYPGGTQELMTFIMKNMKYPSVARRMGTQGRVFVGFVVDTQGVITEVNVVKGVSKECDEESMRVVSKMPNWKPGLQRGKPVRVRYVMPLNFKLAR